MAKRRLQKQGARLAREAARREDHARLVAKRSGDSQFLQRNVTPTQIEYAFPKSAETDLLFNQIKDQMERFQARFGREPRPDEPIFFDPDSDEPRPYPMERYKQDITNVAQETAMSGDLETAAYFLAMRDVGYLVTTATAHTFSLAEIDAFTDAVERHLDELEAAEAGHPQV